MKKLIVIMVVLAMALAGCCTRVDPVTKASTKTFGNCLTTAQQILCNPTDAQKAEAASIVAFLTSGIAIGSIFVNVPITADQVQLIFGMIQSGGCVLVSDLNLALAWYAALTATLQTQAQAKAGGKLKGGAVPPPVKNLYFW